MANDTLIILHTNDIHGRIEGLARVATLVEATRAEDPRTPVLYFDAGDSEETSVRLSNLTKGVAMHSLLSAAGCDAAAVGNAAAPRYGPQVLAAQARAARYPLVLANLQTLDGAPLPGVQPTAIVSAGRFRVGLIGVTTNEGASYETFFGLLVLPVAPLVRELAATLRDEGADAVILLSHLGLTADRELAAALPELTAIIGGHTHDLLPEGEWINGVLVAQAGEYAQNLGWIELQWDGERLKPVTASVLPIDEDVAPAPAVLIAARDAEAALESFLDQIVGELAAPLDFAPDRECGVGDLMADALRERMGTEMALVTVGQAFTGPLPGGPLPRRALWEVCSSTANPGVATLTGAQLTAIVAKGQDAAFAAETPRTLRGAARGLIHLSGAAWHDGRLLVGGQPVAPQQTYRVAATDWEFEQYGGYTDPAWGVQASYEVPTILREVLEDYLAAYRPLTVSRQRIGNE